MHYRNKLPTDPKYKIVLAPPKEYIPPFFLPSYIKPSVSVPNTPKPPSFINVPVYPPPASVLVSAVPPSAVPPPFIKPSIAYQEITLEIGNLHKIIPDSEAKKDSHYPDKAIVVKHPFTET
jgi:hypothetical protein